MSPFLRLVLICLAAVLPLGGMAETFAGEEGYREPRFGEPLFDVQALGLDVTERQQTADTLVKVAYYLADKPQAGASALALADSFVPGHSGAKVANFRLRMGQGYRAVQMVIVDDLVADLLQRAARILHIAEGEDGNDAVRFLLDVISHLSVETEANQTQFDSLKRAVPGDVNWGLALEPHPPGGR
ncbi:MAG: hypothetical protein AAF191_04555 [Verrucomicrobiota bacterium]